MQTSRVTALLVALAGVTVSAASVAVAENSAAAASQCLRLTNSTASIYSTIKLVAEKNSDLANLPLYEIFAPLDKELPWLSTCLASADILSVGLGLVSDPTAAQCLGLLTGSGSSNGSASGISGDTDFSTSLCPSMNTTIFPCVNNVLAGAVDKLMASGGDCCADMTQKLPELLGKDLKSFLEALMIRVGDLLCSVKTYVDPADGKTKTQTCGNAIVGALVNTQALINVVELLQIPSDQACAAMKGENFTDTTGASLKLFTDQTPLDSCFAPIDALFTDLGKLPMIATSNVSAMFDSGKCLKGEAMIAMALDDKGLVQGMIAALDNVVADMMLMPAGAVTKAMRDGFTDLEPDFGPVCFHLPNSVTNCVYDSQVAYAFSADAPPPSSAEKHATAPSVSSGATARVGSASIFMTALVVVASLVSQWF